MAIRNVVQVGDDILRKKCFEVTSFDEKLGELLDDMRDTVRKEDGAGLAAPQVGILRRVVVVDVKEGFYEFVNPVIVDSKGEQTGYEGCLSARKARYRYASDGRESGIFRPQRKAQKTDGARLFRTRGMP